MAAALKRGRPTIYDPDVAEAVCKRMELGETLRAIGRDPDMPDEATVRTWAVRDEQGFHARYTRARELQAHALAEAVVDDTSAECGPDQDAHLLRVRMDATKWFTSKMLPKVYGDKTIIAGDPDAPLVITDNRRNPTEYLVEFRGKVPPTIEGDK